MPRVNAFRSFALLLLLASLSGRGPAGARGDELQRDPPQTPARPQENARPKNSADPPTNTSKWTVPSSTQQDEARAKLKERLRSEFAKARKPDAMSALAEKLLAEIETAEDAPATYALLAEAAALFARAGDLPRAFTTVTSAADKFDGAVLPLKAYAALAVASPTTPKQAGDLHAQLTELATEASLASRYDLAVDVSAALVNALKRPAFKGLRDDAVRNAKQVAAASDAFKAASPSADKLKSDPADPGASLAWGRFLCFYQQNWQAGLPLLAQSQDKTWAPIASRELKPPDKPAELLQLGDDWFKAGDKEKDPLRLLSREKADAAWQLALQSAPADEADAMAQKFDQRLVKLFGSGLAATSGDAAGVMLPRTERFVPAESFTFEFWFSTRSKAGTLISKRHSQGDASVICHIDKEKIGLSVSAGAGEGGTGGGPAISDGRWHHLALVKQESQLTVYVDGQQAARSETAEDLASSSPWKLGTSYNRIPLAARFGGVRISNSARYTESFSPHKVFAKDSTTLFP